MNKPKWWRKLQYHRHQKRRITSGLVYHKHCNQVIVSKQELYIQLKESWVNENLLACLAFGPSHPRYAYWLLMASIKFWFIGSLSYPLHSSREKAHTARGATAQRGKYSSRFPPFGRIPTDEYNVAKLPRQYYERELFDSFRKRGGSAGAFGSTCQALPRNSNYHSRKPLSQIYRCQKRLPAYADKHPGILLCV